ncbi:unnamed protein product [Sympodiomycopsis kandeliae]
MPPRQDPQAQPPPPPNPDANNGGGDGVGIAGGMNVPRAASITTAANLFTTQRLALYGAASVTAALAVVARAFRERSNFYAAVVWLARSNGCMLVLLNFTVFMTLMLGKVCQAIFFGPLRSVEVEHIYERSWYAVTETLLAMTIFRDEFDSSFVVLFGTLLFLKVFHWLCSDRVELMEQSQSVSRLFHARMVSVLWTLLCLDLFLVAFTIEVLTLDKQRMGIMIMFASEFMVLTATLGSIIAKYTINCIDMRSEEPWQGKSMYISAVDLVTDFCKLATYLVFFCLILTYYGLPLNIVRDVYVTARSFFGRIRDLLRYRAATRNMNTRFPNATHDDLRRTDGTCIICREEMVAAGPDTTAAQRQDDDNPQDDDDTPDASPTQQRPAANGGLNETPKKLICGHIFHFHCLRSWLERQQSCPTCRRTVFETTPATSATAAGTARPGAGVQAGAQPTPVPANAAVAAGNAPGQQQQQQQQQQQPQQGSAGPAGTLLRPPGLPDQGQRSPRVNYGSRSGSLPSSSRRRSVEFRRSSVNNARERLEQLLSSVVNGQQQQQHQQQQQQDVNGGNAGPDQYSRLPTSMNWQPPHPSSLSAPRAHLPSPSATSSTANAPAPALTPTPTITSPTYPIQSSPLPSPRLEDPEDPRTAARMAALRRFEALGRPSSTATTSSTSQQRSVTSPFLSSPFLSPASTPVTTAFPTSSSTTIPSIRIQSSDSDSDPQPPVSNETQSRIREQLRVVEESQRDLYRISTNLTRALSLFSQQQQQQSTNQGEEDAVVVSEVEPDLSSSDIEVEEDLQSSRKDEKGKGKERIDDVESVIEEEGSSTAPELRADPDPDL